MKLLLPRVNRTRVREAALVKVRGFRRSMADAIQVWLDRAAVSGDAYALLDSAIHAGRYGETFLNAWVETRLV